ncbi:hypothetical protein ABW21_db0203302 [Orbilia brochopaga]|nr:hypothetical protein ABW21_db0203302 [Drechslerella brochopaga]
MNPFTEATGKIVLGGAGWSRQLITDPSSKPVLETVLHALSLGIRAFDTSPYYDPSEILLGAAFSSPEIASRYKRSELLLMTKCGRIHATKFDYSPAAIRASVQRSLTRFSTTYLDVVFAHDVEFMGREQCLDAVRTLFELKDEGIVRYVGISGYPLAVLADRAVYIREELGRCLDAVQSYCHMNLQNTKLKEVLPTLYGAGGVGVVLNASPLCMGLLRSGGVPIGELGNFHPAPHKLQDAAARAAEYVEKHGESMASLALRYAVGEFASVDKKGGGITILGGGSIEEIDENVATVKKVLKRVDGNEEDGDLRAYTVLDEDVRQADWALVDGVRRILVRWLDFSWPSPDAEYVGRQRQNLTS